MLCSTSNHAIVTRGVHACTAMTRGLARLIATISRSKHKQAFCCDLVQTAASSSELRRSADMYVYAVAMEHIRAEIKGSATRTLY